MGKWRWHGPSLRCRGCWVSAEGRSRSCCFAGEGSTGAWRSFMLKMGWPHAEDGVAQLRGQKVSSPSNPKHL